MVSIVTLHLQREEHTRRLVDSLYEHTVLPFELVVVSQDATPRTAAFLAELGAGRPNLSVVRNETNVGTAAGRNQGVRAGSGEFSVVVDNDVEVTPDWLEPLLDTARGDPSVGCVGAMILTRGGLPQYCSHYMVERTDDDGRPSIGLHFDRWLSPDAPEVAAGGEVPWYPTTCLLIRRAAFDRIGGFDEAIVLAEEDKDLCLALRAEGYRIVYAPASRVIHDGYPRDPDYARVRENLLRLHADRGYFEEKWSCRVVNESSRSYLLQGGMPEASVKHHERFPFFMKVVP